MLEKIKALKEVLIGEFYQLYEQYNEDKIYGCTLVIDEFLLIDYLAISTERSLFSDDEDSSQYLARPDKWNVQKWRYHSARSSESALSKYKPIMIDYFQQSHIFGNPLLDPNSEHSHNNLELLLDIFKETKDALIDAYGLDVDRTLFFISIPSKPEFEIESAKYLNPENALLDEFLKSKTPVLLNHETPVGQRTKLTQADKDMLINIGQMIEVEPYDYLDVAKEAYLLTLEPHFVDTNIYIQKLIQSIAAMDSNQNGNCALEKEEILERINQFYHTGQFPV